MPQVDFKDYYDTLGVDRGADEKQIRSAFRKLARKHHPDINPGDDGAEERFKEINEAYDVLSDPDRRKLYDRYGEDWQRYKEAGFTGDEQYAPNARQGPRYEDFGSWFTGQRPGSSTTNEFGGDSSGNSDFFETLFGDGTSFRGSRRGDYTPRPRRGSDMDADVTVSFREAFDGTTRRFDIQTQDLCPTCGGQGFAGDRICQTCGGSGYTERTRSIEVTIPPGVDTGSRIRVAGQGGQGTNGGPDGDVYLRVTVSSDRRFERDGANLRAIVDVPLYTAMLGGTVRVPTPRSEVELTIPAGTQQGKQFRLRGQGMPKLKTKSNERGDLLARANVVLPNELSTEETRLFEQLRDLSSMSKV